MVSKSSRDRVMYEYSKKKKSLTLSLDLVHSQKSSTGKLVGPMLVDGAHDTCPRLSKKNTSAEWVQYRSIHLLR